MCFSYEIDGDGNKDYEHVEGGFAWTLAVTWYGRTVTSVHVYSGI